MKKKTAILAIAVFMLTALPSTALAHGHGNSVQVKQKYSVCTVENCNVTGVHKHGGTYCYGHSYHNTNKAGDGCH